MLVFVCGSARRGEPDYHVVADATFIAEIWTVAKYRMHTVGDRHPGIYETLERGVALAGELYDLSEAQWESFLLQEPPGLYPALVELENGCHATAMLFPRERLSVDNEDISQYGGWKTYKQSLAQRRD